MILFSHFSGYSSTTYGESEDLIKLEPDSQNIENAILSIEDAKLEDRKTYTCVASNKSVRTLRHSSFR
jgi:hypothetical protein